MTQIPSLFVLRIYDQLLMFQGEYFPFLLSIILECKLGKLDVTLGFNPWRMNFNKFARLLRRLPESTIDDFRFGNFAPDYPLVYFSSHDLWSAFNCWKYLRTIWFTNIRLFSGQFYTLWKPLSNCIYLEDIKFSNMNLECKDLREIHHILRLLPSLRNLSFSCNRISDLGLRYFCDGLPRFDPYNSRQKIIVFDFHRNQITDVGVHYFCDQIIRQQIIIFEIHLDQNQIGSQGMKNLQIAEQFTKQSVSRPDLVMYTCREEL